MASEQGYVNLDARALVALADAARRGALAFSPGEGPDGNELEAKLRLIAARLERMDRRLAGVQSTPTIPRRPLREPF